MWEIFQGLLWYRFKGCMTRRTMTFKHHIAFLLCINNAVVLTADVKFDQSEYWRWYTRFWYTATSFSKLISQRFFCSSSQPLLVFFSHSRFSFAPHKLNAWLIYWLIDLLNDWFTNLLIYIVLFYLMTDWFIVWITNCQIYLLTDWFNSWFVSWLNDLLIDLLTDWFTELLIYWLTD